jgi:hypothetical protein
MVIGRWPATPTVAIVGRVERHADRDHAIIATGTLDGFRAEGASRGVDVRPSSRFAWRNGARVRVGDARVFPDRGTRDGRSTRHVVVVTSLGVTF